MGDLSRRERLIEHRKARGWGRQQLAAFAGLSTNTIWKLENDEDAWDKATGETISKIAVALSVSAEDLTGEPVQVSAPPPMAFQYEELRTIYEALPQSARDTLLATGRGLLKIVRERE